MTDEEKAARFPSQFDAVISNPPWTIPGRADSLRGGGWKKREGPPPRVDFWFDFVKVCAPLLKHGRVITSMCSIGGMFRARHADFPGIGLGMIRKLERAEFDGLTGKIMTMQKGAKNMPLKHAVFPPWPTLTVRAGYRRDLISPDGPLPMLASRKGVVYTSNGAAYRAPIIYSGPKVLIGKQPSRDIFLDREGNIAAWGGDCLQVSGPEDDVVRFYEWWTTDGWPQIESALADELEASPTSGWYRRAFSMLGGN